MGGFKGMWEGVITFTMCDSPHGGVRDVRSLQLGKTLCLEFHEYSRISKRPIPPCYSKKIQDVGIPWIFKLTKARNV